MRTELKTDRALQPAAAAGLLRAAAAVFVPGMGSSVNGARRWINLGVSKFQAVEAVKLLYIVWLASYLVRFRDEVNATWPAMLKPLGVAVALVGCCCCSRTSVPRRCCWRSPPACWCWAACTCRACRRRSLHRPAGAGLASRSLEPYRMRRITSFMDPWADQFGRGYQLSNALMAVGRGEWFGVGLGGSVQKLTYLPEAHTDFIFSVIAEELGFVGVCAGDRRCTRCWPGARSGSACGAWRCGATSPAIARSASPCGSACRASSRSASTWACCRPRA